MRIKYVTILFTLICFGCISCNKEPFVSNNLIHEEKTMEVINRGSVFLKELDTVKDCQYSVVSNDSYAIIGYICKQQKTSGETPFPLLDSAFEYYIYDGLSLKSLDLSPSELYPYLTPIYLNPYDETYYCNKCEYYNLPRSQIFPSEKKETLIMVEPDGTFTHLFDKFGTLITTDARSLPWILFNQADINPHTYIMYNLDNHSQYSFIFDKNIREFYLYEDSLILGFFDELDPLKIHYKIYNLQTEMVSKGENEVSITAPLQQKKHPRHGDKVKFDLIVSNESDSSVLTMYEVKHLYRVIDSKNTMKPLQILYYNQSNSEIAWISNKQNQINLCSLSEITDACNIVDFQSAIIDDEAISQVFPIYNQDTQGFWAIPALTTVGDGSLLYLYTWERGKIQKHEYHIHPCFFEKNTFISEQGELYIISTDYSSSAPVYQLHILNPTNSVAYQTYTLETTSPLLQQNVSSMYFTKLFMNNNQILLEATANSHYHHKNEQLSGLYRIMLSE